jgi:acetyl/propionyl-CoA carboxylase alpha subunit
MSLFLKISGRKILLNQSIQKKWNFVSRPGGWWIAESEEGSRRRFFYAHRPHPIHLSWSVSLGGYLYFAEWIKEDRELQEDPRSAKKIQDLDLIAQFPGKVRKVLVEKNTQVMEGDSLILVEAMKMEFLIKSPSDGKVVAIFVDEGQQVNPGDPFLKLE